MDLTPLVIAGAVIADKKLLRALLGPGAKSIGDWLGQLTTSWQPARRRNLLHHTLVAAKQLGPARFEKAWAQAAFSEWAEGVSMVEPEDEELASVWRAALAAMSEGGHERLVLLDIAKRMRPDEATAFQRLARCRYRIGKGFPVPPAPLWNWMRDSLVSEEKRQPQFAEETKLLRFAELGLVRPMTVRLRGSGGLKLAATFAVALSGALGLTFLFWSREAEPLAYAIRTYASIATGLCAFAAALGLSRTLVNQPPFTPVGEALGYAILDIEPQSAGARSKPGQRKRSTKTA